MIWCLISMVLGALVFGAGIVFEKLVSAEKYAAGDESENNDFNEKLYRQWENLLDYDGTEQEEIEYEE